jgi:hypothetical protein
MLKSAHNFFCLFHKHVMLHGTKASFVLVLEPKKSAVLYEFATCTAVEQRRRAARSCGPAPAVEQHGGKLGHDKAARR